MPALTLTNDDLSAIATKLLEHMEHEITTLIPNATEAQKGVFMIAIARGLLVAVHVAVGEATP